MHTYVDDLTVASTSEQCIGKKEKLRKSHFEIKNLVGIHKSIMKTTGNQGCSGSFGIRQKKYIDKLSRA